MMVKLFLLLFWVGVHCGIYKSSYNISYLNSPPPPFFIPTPPPVSGIVLTGYFHTCIYLYTVFAPYLPSIIFPPPPHSHWYQPSQAGPIPPSCSPIFYLKKKKEKEKNDIFAFVKIATWVVSLWHFQVHIYINKTQIGSSLLLFFFLL
jgi:hypothetical protein